MNDIIIRRRSHFIKEGDDNGEITDWIASAEGHKTTSTDPLKALKSLLKLIGL